MINSRRSINIQITDNSISLRLLPSLSSSLFLSLSFSLSLSLSLFLAAWTFINLNELFASRFTFVCKSRERNLGESFTPMNKVCDV